MSHTKNRKTQDRPRVNATLKDLDVEGSVEPFRFGYKGRVVEFPDPKSLSFEQASVLADIDQNAKAGDVKKALASWIGPDDAQLLMKGLRADQMGALWGQIMKYFEATVGDAEK